MTIVQINCSANGSTGNIAKAIHRSLLAKGENSYIFFGVGTPTEKNMIRIGNDFSLHLHAVLSRNLGKQGYFSYFATRKLIRQLKKIKPDVIHLHNLHGSYVHLPLLFAYLKKAEASIVITLHDCWLFTGKCPHFTVVGCEKWKASCGNCPQLSIYPKSKKDTTSKCLADKKKWLSGFGNRLHIVTVSNWLRDTAMQSFLNQYQIHTVYNGIDPEIFHPLNDDFANTIGEKYGIGKDKFVILGVASVWDDRKGLMEFINLSKKISHSDVIVLVGLSERQIRELPANVIGIRRTENQTELAQLYSRADLFINPSREETFGLVTAEAMACGPPVIVYDSTACSETADASCIVLNVNGKKTMIDAVKEMKNRERAHTELANIFKKESMIAGYINEYANCFSSEE